ncbi:MAG: peptide deformylase [Granulosicoccus sp.]
MAKLEIVEYPDPILRQRAKPVEDFNESTQVLVANLIETLYSTSGIGLCAPQVGQSTQILVMDLSDKQNDPEVFMNPVILAKAGFAIVEESCLSIPGVAAKVIRSGVISIRAQNQEGQLFEKEFDGMKAVCLQHEIDHLEGKLFIDRLSRLRRFRLRQKLHRLENNAASSILQPA